MEGNDSRNSSNHILQSRCRTFRPNILEAQKIKRKDQESKNKQPVTLTSQHFINKTKKAVKEKGKIYNKDLDLESQSSEN